MKTDTGASAAQQTVEYSRRLYDDVLGWYQNADTKAQVVLGLDGAFLAWIAAAAFQKPDDLSTIVNSFQPLTWQLLELMAATVVGSMAAAIYCLWSRIYLRPASIVKSIQARSDARSPNTYPPGVMWFFQFIAALDRARFRQTLMGVDAGFEIEVMASQIAALSKNVRKKHIAANVGFALAIVTLLLFAGAAASYVASV